MNRFYIVQSHDTLTKIAKKTGTTTFDLRNLNHLPDPNRLSVGQKLYLRKEDVCGFTILFLDADRNPINKLSYVLEFSGKNIKGTTGEDGKGKTVFTDSPTDDIRILVKRFDGTLKEVVTVKSGYRNKLCTVITPIMVLDTDLKPHPKPNPDKPAQPLKPIHGPDNPPPPTTNKEPGPKTTPTTGPNGEPLTKAEGDIPALDEFLDQYVGGEVSQSDIDAAAKELRCDPGLIYAIAKQESASSSFFKLGNRTVPKILFERHQFKYRTRPNPKSPVPPSPYEAIYHDICGPQYKRAKKNKDGVWIELKSGEAISINEIYGPEGLFQYNRLCKAYQLSPEAALQSCSWGKFQIMGFNYKNAGFKDIRAFTKAMSRGDAEHIKAFLKFAKSNKVLLHGLQTTNFEEIAKGHNGEEWRKINPEYASNLKKYYSQYHSINE